MCDVVAELDAANKKIESLERQFRRLEVEKRDLNQGVLLFILYND